MTTIIETTPSGSAGEGIVIGPTFTGFLDRVAPPAARETLTADATAILSSASVRMDCASKTVGLVVGRIQSGKTVSYEALIALARDNGFSLVVVLSGISRPLLRQGHARLTGDLTKADANGWKFFTNASLDPINESELRSVRDNWADPGTPPQLKKTAVCLLLKHYGHINNFAELCDQIGWHGQRVLIIDDEADQASLNTKHRRGLESPTYHNILELRGVFPHHAYLQYTATPQAPLLIAITDSLSPDFVRVIDPGTAYVGGQDFFGQPNSYVSVIPQGDLQGLTQPLATPPDSLVKAFREFLIGASHTLASGSTDVRSMLVHPSRTTDLHERFDNWIRQLKSFWGQVLDSDEEDDIAALRDDFATAYAAIAQTAPDIEPFDACWISLKYVLRNLQIIEMNTRLSETPEFDWDASTAYVLVGGQAIDRGFTVEGLSVTYMPRDPGARTADSLQQRARFFGYKRDYLGECRIYLEPLLRDMFEHYVEHETVMIDTLRRISTGELTLKDWRRSFLLDSSMRATRANVIGLAAVSVSPGENWIFDGRPPIAGADTTETAQKLEALLAPYESTLDSHGHLHVAMTVKDLLEITEALPPEFDSRTTPMTGLQLQLAHLIDSNPDEPVEFMRMRAGATNPVRSLSGGRVQPFEGRSATYSGDRHQFDPERITVQAHFFSVRKDPLSAPFGSRLVLAFRLPLPLAESWLIEDQT